MELPAGLDYAWFACDAEGYVARFTNGGEGPIPAAVLVHRDAADHAESLANDLPFVGKCELKVYLPAPSNFTQIACRGFFGYDWRDAIRQSKRSGCYETISRPLVPLRAEALPAELRRLVELVRFERLAFATSDAVCVSRLVECVV